MKVQLAILTCNRPSILELCLLKLGLTDEHREHLEVVVCGNDKDNTGCEVAERCGVKYLNIHYNADPVDMDPARTAQISLGRGRRDIVDLFLTDDKYRPDDYLVMLDDDILVTADTILEAIEDFKAFSKSTKVSCVSLHPFKKRLSRSSLKIGNKLFNFFDYTGECAMIWQRSVLSAVGNHFGPIEGGHGDKQFEQARSHGSLITRFHPPYEMQHVGFEPLCPSLVFGHLVRGPGWTRQPLKDYTGTRILFEDELTIWRSQGLDALKTLLKEGTMIGTKKATPVEDRFPKAWGEVHIQKVRKSDGEVVEDITTDNLVVDKAKEIMAHLLSGDDPDNYKVSKMTFGTNDDAPTPEDLVVKTPITPVKPIASVEYPNASSVRFIVTLDQDEANGFPIAEAGLQAQNGLVARVSFGPLTKDSDFIFIFRWTIYW